jgi:2-oxoglutarate ferredoxin oxidoreductase subunit alpha
VLSWGGTYGACATAVRESAKRGLDVAHAHLRYLNPFPANLGSVLHSYDHVLIPELNLGQLLLLIRGQFHVDAIGLNKVQGKPFCVSEVFEKITELADT